VLVIQCPKGWEPLQKLDSGGVFCIIQSKSKVLSLLILIRLYFMSVAVGSLFLLQGAVQFPLVSQLVRGPFELSAFKSYMSEIFIIVTVLVLVLEFG